MNSIKKNFIFNVIKSIAPMVFAVISYAYASRILDVEMVGRVQYATSIISYFALFAALGISLYAAREGSKYVGNRQMLSKHFQEMFLINLISTGIVYVVLFLTLAVNLFDAPQVLMLICGLNILFTTLSIEWLYQIVEDFQFISVCSIIVQFIAMIILLIGVKHPSDYNLYALTTVLSTSGSFLFNLIYAKKYVDFKVTLKLSLRKHIKPILIIFGIGVASSIYLNLDMVMIKWIQNEYAVGLYTTAVKLNNLVKALISAISLVALPRLSYFLAKGEKENYHKLLKYGINLNLGLAIPCATGLFLLSREIILLYSGVNYLDATVASQILSLNVAFSAIDGLLYYQVLIPHKKEIMACIGTAVGAVTNLILNALLIPVYGINGAALATLLSEASVFLMFMILLRKTIPLKEMFAETWKYIVASIGIILVVLGFKLIISNNIILLLVCIPIAAIVYFIILLAVRNSLAKDLLQDAKNIIVNILHF